MYNLEEVRSSIQRITSGIADALKIEVAIFDNDSKIFCCTPTYLKRKGRTVHAPSINEVLSYGSVLVNTPGEMASCIGCRFKDNCPSTIEILSCIKVDGLVMGVMAMTSFTKEGHQRITSNLQIYHDVITEISSLIGEIIINRTGDGDATKMDNLVHGIFEVSRNSLILTDSNGVITQCNSIAVKNLNSCNLMTSSLWHILPENIVKRILSGEEFFENEVSMENYCARLTTKNIIKNDNTAAIVLKFSNETFIDEQNKDYLSRIVGNSNETQKVHSLITKLADSPTPVLITGETGTGKELVARALHERSRRKRYPFVAINCSSIPENLFESELFGYEEGSFTGAKKGGKIGKIEMAQGGTLFLDELGEMPLSAQPKLLRVLQEHELERVGSTEKISLDIRVIAATNKDLQDMMRLQKFREDLYYRIGVINIELPPLRNRSDDVLPIAVNYLQKLKQKLDTPLEDFDSSIKNFFNNYSWPGNIRELQNVIEYAANLSEKNLMSINDLPPKLLAENISFDQSTALSSQKLEEQHILDLLDEFGYSLEGKNRVAKAIGVSLRTLYRKMQKYGI
ncbi:MAG: sigma-54 dependent transcriptional regulator [Proteocatella sp.]